MRDYGTAEWDGGDPDCDHIDWKQQSGSDPNHKQSTNNNGFGGVSFAHVCGKCGAKRIDSQLGLEKTPEEYVAKMVEVFREVRRVLRKDGSLWLNLGDSYASAFACDRRSVMGNGSPDADCKRPNRLGSGLKEKDLCGIPWRVAFALQADGWWLRSDIIWSKLNPMPESVTDRPTKAHEYLFLFAKGSWVHRTIKFSDLPDEFVHFVNHGWEQVSPVRELMLSRVAVKLATALLDCSQGQDNLSLPPFYDEVWKQTPDGSDSSFVRGLPVEHRATVAANRFLSSQCSTKRFLQELQRLIVNHPATYHFLKAGIISQFANTPHIYCNGDSSFTVNDSGHICEFQIVHGQIIIAKPTSCNYFYDAEAIKEKGSEPLREREANNGESAVLRNKRSVWTIATAPYPEAHFAVFPPDLVKPCIMAGTSAKGCCAKCGAPWERVVERTPYERNHTDPKKLGTLDHHQSRGSGGNEGMIQSGTKWNKFKAENPDKTLGWQPTCECRFVTTRPLTRDRSLHRS